MRRISALFLAAALAVACQVEELVPSTVLTITANKEGDGTKTVRQSDGSVLWSPLESISVFVDSGTDGGYKFKSDATEAAPSATFKGSVNIYSPGSTLYAVYPYKSSTVCEDGKITTSLSASQTAVPGTFDNKLFISVAKSTSTDMTFRNVCGGLMFSVSQEGISKVVFKGNSGEALAGEARISFGSNDEPSVSVVNAKTEITLKPESGNFIPGEWYFIVTYPTEFENGFSIKMYKDGKSSTYQSGNRQEIRRSVFGSVSGIDSRLRFDDSEAIDLSYAEWADAYETANSYIVPEAGFYKFPLKKGNSSKTISGVTSVDVLWESVGIDQDARVGSIIRTASLSDGYVSFETGETLGNAVIAARNSSGKVLWSWHIWRTPVPEDQVYKRNAGVVMDRNLGALAAVPGTDALGLKYQWGRKDPFVAGGQKATKGRTVEPFSENGYEGVDPTVFLTGGTMLDKNLWGGGDSKTVNDPCPAGYRVPKGGPGGLWATALGSTGTIWYYGFDYSDYGYEMGGTLTSSGSCWYPSTGNIDGVTGNQHGADGYGSYWAANVSADSGDPYQMVVFNPNGIWPSYSSKTMTEGSPVRCVRDQSSNLLHVESVSLDAAKLDLRVGNVQQLVASVKPENAANRQLVWSSSDISVARVDSDGRVEAMGEGSAVVTVTTVDGGYEASCSVRVLPEHVHVTGITLDADNMTLYTGYSRKLNATIIPDYADDPSVTWSSSKESVATVDENGLVTAVSAGSATITVKANDSGVTAKCNVTVKKSLDYADGEVVVLQEGMGKLDLVLLGDGFIREDIDNGTYDSIMRQAYNEFFSKDPFTHLKDEFNVYYVNAVSAERLNAINTGANGASNTGSDTKFKVQFTPYSTSVGGDNDIVEEYAMKAFTHDAYDRMDNATVVVMANQECRAGTCHTYYYKYSSADFGRGKSIAYCALGRYPEERVELMLHEICGHGFGKLADEYYYENSSINTGLWYDIDRFHSVGLYRNVDKYVEDYMAEQLDGAFEVTTRENVYWHDLFGTYNNYESYNVESLGVYKGGYTYSFGFCRPTQSGYDSIMNENSGIFNAISRRQIYYRYLRLSGLVEENQYGTQEELERFLEWDAKYNLPNMHKAGKADRSKVSVPAALDGRKPLAPPVLYECEMEGGRSVVKRIVNPATASGKTVNRR